VYSHRHIPQAATITTTEEDTMDEIKCNVRISRVTGVGDPFLLQIKDEVSGLVLLDLRMTTDGFADLLSNRGTDAIGTIIGSLENVNKVRFSTSITVPSNFDGSGHIAGAAHRLRSIVDTWVPSSASVRVDGTNQGLKIVIFGFEPTEEQAESAKSYLLIYVTDQLRERGFMK
jgi:hypothetical protein